MAGLGLIITSLAAGVGLLAAPMMTPSAPVDAQTGCRTDQPPPTHAVVLVDASEALEPRHKRALTAAVAKAQRETPKHGRVSVVVLDADHAQEPRWLASLCSPGDAADANPWFANPARTQARWRAGFAEPISEAAAQAGARSREDASPISAALRALGEDARVREAHTRTLVLVSDLMEHTTDGASLYDPNRRFDAGKDAVARLEGVAVSIVLIDRPRRAAVQASAFERYWRDWFAASGVVEIDAGAAQGAADTAAVINRR